MLDTINPPSAMAAGEAISLPSVADVVATHVRPNASSVDADGIYPEQALRLLGQAGAYQVFTDKSGPGSGLAGTIAAMASVGESCLSTSFCMWCQSALVWYLANTQNAALKERFLEAAASGRQLGGTGLSNPMKSFSGIEPLALKGKRVAGGYRVSGRLPWVSNLGPDHLFGSIFATEDGGKIMALFDCGRPELRLMQNAHFIALEGTATYTVGIKDYFVPDSEILAEDAASFVPKIRQGFVLLQAGMAIGIARGIAEAMEQDSGGRDAAAWLPVGPAQLLQRADELQQAVNRHAATAFDTDKAVFHDVLLTRLKAAFLALDAARAGTLQFGARGYIAGSDIFRRLREAQFVAIVTPSVKHISKELAG